MDYDRQNLFVIFLGLRIVKLYVKNQSSKYMFYAFLKLDFCVIYVNVNYDHEKKKNWIVSEQYTLQI